MSFQEFVESLDLQDPPPLSNPLLVALWHDAKGDWSRAHTIAQDIDGSMACWIHAYLHRKEGDRSNAHYWYDRAGKNMPTDSLEQEWSNLVRALI